MIQGLRREQDVGPELQHVFELVNHGPSVISRSSLEVRCPLRAQSQGLLYPLELTTEGPLTCRSQHQLNALNLKLEPASAQTVAQIKPQSSEHRVKKRDAQPLAEHGNLTCSVVECWRMQCDVGRLNRGDSAIIRLRSRLWAETFIERIYKQHVVECTVHYKVEKMPYSIPPLFTPSLSKKVVCAVLWNKPDSVYPVPVWIVVLAVLLGLLLLSLLIYLLYKMGFFKRSDPYATTMEKAHLRPQASSEA